ncbi:hypothetical protein MPTK1_1g07010 [Marchantia polymorpha subsp. ruderalis]|uniref:Uncharacterized protein n=2 Tax=Marchantia polymorpha TaxID=3197 RepID=A0AAF6AME7_MARPO|nr:hypothetical protein MARPO_0043s0092 [Marchantia polymorpha]BBM97617.1 hypothetical protein Mp_1g07010 [Marchantia polymorpha subsp. ruderalis]|eukprot:PTQ39857.1 hypothetical protein MARPO_0043s0092 [Marchantia polymorpha]
MLTDAHNHSLRSTDTETPSDSANNFNEYQKCSKTDHLRPVLLLALYYSAMAHVHTAFSFSTASQGRSFLTHDDDEVLSGFSAHVHVFVSVSRVEWMRCILRSVGPYIP